MLKVKNLIITIPNSVLFNHNQKDILLQMQSVNKEDIQELERRVLPF